MKKVFILAIALLCTISLYGSDNSKKIIKGFDGGMMLHLGYLQGNIAPIGYKAQGMTAGIGGVLRLYVGDHWRIGTEGYVSTLNQLQNGSYVKYSWGGILADYRYQFGKLIPFAGLTIGGGANKDLFMFETSTMDWVPVNNTIYQKQTFIMVDPFIGCEYVHSDALHLSLKADWVNVISQNRSTIPQGPRLYLGFIFTH